MATRPETSKADEQDVSIRETESTTQLVDLNSFNNSTNKDRSDTSKNDDFPTIIVNSEIKKAIIAADPKQPERSIFVKIRSKAVVYFQQTIMNTIRSKTTKILIMFFFKYRPCLLPILLVIFS